MATSQRERVNVEGHELTLTNLGKILYPETGTTKAEVLEYYAAVAPFLIPAAANRPATRKRWVQGVGTATHPGQMFFQKNLDSSTPSWVPRVTIQHSDHSNVYPMVNNLATLTWLAQIASLEIHVPQWQVDADGAMLPPDRLVLDLDPGPGTGLPECVEVAKLARSILQDMGLDPVPVTSGSKGIHLYAGLDGTQKWEQVSAFAHELARSLEADHRDLVVSDMKKTLRKGKVLVDWSQNSGNKTTIVPYSLRGRAHPMVAAPRTWRELASPKLEHLDFTAVMKRVKEGKDPFAAVEAAARSARPPEHGASRSKSGSSGSSGSRTKNDDGDPPRPARASTAVAGVVPGENAGGTAVNPRLATYLDKRDPQRTPEPFPARQSGSRPLHDDAESNPTGGIFVIQEHHARRFHLDFRLEHDGVLASWALPRGVPETPDKNHLAVRTEDHPMEYAEFSGIIPKGEYGAGTVSIWDSGEFECEKWRDGKEVIATLTGKPGGGLHGTRRFALIHTGESPSQWLIHLMKDKPGRTVLKSPAAEANGTPSYAPMLATSGTAADVASGDWLFELKWDGFRAIVSGSAGKIRLTSRSGIDMTPTYPELADPRYWPAHDFVADGEIVALGKNGHPSFELLQKRMNLFKPGDVERARAAVPVQLMVFDLLYDAGAQAGADLTSLPLSERRKRLSDFRAGLPSKGSPIHVSEILEHDLDDILASASELGLEGVMAKRADSRYHAGRRSRSWIKLKLERMQEVVVGGWRPGSGARQGTIGALLVGIPDGDKLRYAGRVGSGFKDWQLRDILKRLQGMDRPDSPFHDIPAEDARGAQWVSPELVGEVTFGEWTGGGRMRHPVWRGWRPDKSPEDVRRT